MAETVLAKMAVEISANAANFTKQLNQVEGKLNSFANNLGNTAKSIGIAFGVQQVASFAFEVAKLAGEAEGVSAAFDRLPNSVQLMNQLKEATAGTVSELDLMKRTVQATNFGIELESLPKLLEFAAIRAQQTGQSVDYLVDSIVTGIGRKSPLILDNLGISAVALKDKMGGVALATASIGEVSRAVGEIANDELQKMGGFSENASTKIQRLTASWDDFKVVLGGAVTAGGLLAGVLDDLTGILKSLSGGGDQANFIQFQKNLAESIKNDSEPAIKTMMRELNLMRNELKTPISESFAKTLVKDFKLSTEQGDRFLQIVKEINGETKKAEPVKVADPVQIITLESLQEKVKQLNQEFADLDVTNKAALATKGQEIIGINAQIKALEELRKAREASKGTESINPNSVNAYQKALEGLNKELENVNVKDTDRIRILSAQIAGYEDAIQRVNALKNSFKDISEIVLIPPDLSSLFTGLDMEPIVARFETGLAAMAASAKVHTDSIKASFIDMGPLIAGGLSGVAEALGSAIAGVGNFGQDIIKVVASFAKQLGEILIATAIGALALKKFAISHPVAAIAAGVALVALASAAGAAASKAHSSTFSGGGSAGTTTAQSPIRSSSVSATEAQDVKVSGSVQVRGQDMWILFKNVEENNKFLKATGG